MTNFLYFNRYVFFLNYTDPLNSQKVCVKSCPETNIKNELEFIKYTETANNSLCMYDAKQGAYDPEKCPKLPIVKSLVFCYRLELCF